MQRYHSSALTSGATSYLLKDAPAEKLLQAIRTASQATEHVVWWLFSVESGSWLPASRANRIQRGIGEVAKRPEVGIGSQAG
jgi:DNA-binding NarL/FixJ family response regulator